MANKKYESHTIIMDVKDYTQKMNEFGAEGWRTVAVLPQLNTPSLVMIQVFLEREIS